MNPEEIQNLILDYGDTQAAFAASSAGYGTTEYTRLQNDFMRASEALQEAMRALVGPSFTLSHLEHWIAKND